MIKARIFQPDKNAMQSGKAKTAWVLEFAPEASGFVDNLMGWNGMTDMPQEIRLHFASEEEAVSYAVKQQLTYEISQPNKRKKIRKAYADNFKFDKMRDVQWHS